MVGCMTYILNKLKIDNEYIYSHVFNQIIVKMFGWSDYVVD